MKYQKELSVGGLALLSLVFLGVFLWMMGTLGPWFRHGIKLHVLYSFAGGVEVGSPVRVSGVKVGQVEGIEFLSVPRDVDGDRVSLKITLGIEKRAQETVRADSRFYINMAGVIGERYVEITPGDPQKPKLASGTEVRGVDPPRIDQLLSQGYGLFGRIQELLMENEKTITEFLKQTSILMKEANELMGSKDRRTVVSLITNMNAVSEDLRYFTREIRGIGGRNFVEQVKELVNRAHKVDGPVIKKFMQEEGIRARIF